MCDITFVKQSAALQNRFFSLDFDVLYFSFTHYQTHTHEYMYMLKFLVHVSFFLHGFSYILVSKFNFFSANPDQSGSLSGSW